MKYKNYSYWIGSKMVYIRKIRWINSRVYSLILKPSRSCFFGTWRYATFYRKILRKECKRISQKNMSRFPNTQIISRCKFWQDLKFLQPINIDHKRCPTWYAEHFLSIILFLPRYLSRKTNFTWFEILQQMFFVYSILDKYLTSRLL